MDIVKIRLILNVIFENRIIMKNLKTKYLKHYKECIDLELKKREHVL